MISIIFDQQLIALTCSSLEQFNVSTLALKRAYMFHDTKEVSYVIVTLIWYIRYSLHFLGTGKSLSEALILHQLTHNMTKDCSLNYEVST